MIQIVAAQNLVAVLGLCKHKYEYIYGVDWLTAATFSTIIMAIITYFVTQALSNYQSLRARWRWCTTR